MPAPRAPITDMLEEETLAPWLALLNSSTVKIKNQSSNLH